MSSKGDDGRGTRYRGAGLRGVQHAALLRARRAGRSALRPADPARDSLAIDRDGIVEAALSGVESTRPAWGRPRAITDEQLAAIRAALEGGMSKAAACRTFGVRRTTLIEALRRAG